MAVLIAEALGVILLAAAGVAIGRARGGCPEFDVLGPEGQMTRAEAQRMTENQIGSVVIEAAIAVHRELGPGLLESVYQVVLARELSDRGLKVERQVSVPITYKGIRFDEGFRADIIVEGKVILELKSVEHVSAAHKKQVLTYMRLTGCKLGYLLNFGEEVMKTGITRCVDGLEE